MRSLIFFLFLGALSRPIAFFHLQSGEYAYRRLETNRSIDDRESNGSEADRLEVAFDARKVDDSGQGQRAPVRKWWSDAEVRISCAASFDPWGRCVAST